MKQKNKNKYYNDGWIRCSERMPEEHDSIFAKWNGTSKWDEYMWLKYSDDVLVTVEYDNKVRMVDKMKTHDGKWYNGNLVQLVHFKIIAWKPMPEVYKGDI